MNVAGRSEIVGTPQVQAPTSCADAWLNGHYATVRLSDNLEAVRVPVGAGVAQSSRDFFATGAGAGGRWFAVGDVILTRSALTDPQALSGGLPTIDWCVLKAGSIVNVGAGHPLFGHGGGGEQVELVDGPEPEVGISRRD